MFKKPNLHRVSFPLRQKPFLAQGACTDPEHNPRVKRFSRSEVKQAVSTAVIVVGHHTCGTCGSTILFSVANGPTSGYPRLNSQGILDFGGAGYVDRGYDLPSKQFPESHKFERDGCTKFQRGFTCDFCDMNASLGRIKYKPYEPRQEPERLRAPMGEMA